MDLGLELILIPKIKFTIMVNGMGLEQDLRNTKKMI